MITILVDKDFTKWLQIWHEIPPSCELHFVAHFQQRHVDL